MAKKLNLFQYRKKHKIRRKGVHAKSKTRLKKNFA